VLTPSKPEYRARYPCGRVPTPRPFLATRIPVSARTSQAWLRRFNSSLRSRRSVERGLPRRSPSGRRRAGRSKLRLGRPPSCRGLCRRPSRVASIAAMQRSLKPQSTGQHRGDPPSFALSGWIRVKDALHSLWAKEGWLPHGSELRMAGHQGKKDFRRIGFQAIDGWPCSTLT